jgi:hypothetical protein
VRTAAATAKPSQSSGSSSKKNTTHHHHHHQNNTTTFWIRARARPDCRSLALRGDRSDCPSRVVSRRARPCGSVSASVLAASPGGRERARASSSCPPFLRAFRLSTDLCRAFSRPWTGPGGSPALRLSAISVASIHRGAGRRGERNKGAREEGRSRKGKDEGSLLVLAPGGPPRRRRPGPVAARTAAPSHVSARSRPQGFSCGGLSFLWPGRGADKASPALARRARLLSSFAVVLAFAAHSSSR